MVAFEYYQMESEFKYSVRNTKDRENQTKMLPSQKIHELLHNTLYK